MSNNLPAKRSNNVQPLNPLTAVPLPLQPAVAQFALFFGDVIKDRGSLSVRIGHWIAEGYCTEGDARVALRALMAPERCADLDYVGKVQAALAEEIGRAKRARLDEERRLAAVAERRANGPVDPDVRRKIHDLAADVLAAPPRSK